MWDLWVVSAADAKQKLIFEKQLDNLIKKGRLPSNFNCLIIADPERIKAGSGGATLHIYNKLELIYGNELNTKKVIVIHSGGYSKRMAVYSVKGKLFSNISQNQEALKLIEYFFITYDSLAKRMHSGMFIVPGDVRISINTNSVFDKDIIYGVSAKANIETAKNHGVYITDNNNILVKFLHKRKVDILKMYSDKNDELDIDTGIVVMPFCLLEKINEKLGPIDEPLNLYNDFITPLSSDLSESEYIESGIDDGNSSHIIAYRKKLFDLLKDFSMKVIKLSEDFIHIGTSQEYITNLTEEDGIFIDNSIIRKLKHSGNLVIEDSILMGENYIGKGCMVQSVITSLPITLPAGYILSQVPLKINGVDGFATLKYPVSTNPKTTVGFKWLDKCFWFKRHRDDSLTAALSESATGNCSFCDCYNYSDIFKITRESDDIDNRITALEKLENDKSQNISKKLLREAILDTSEMMLPHVYRYLSNVKDDAFYKKSFNKITEMICEGAVTEIDHSTPVINKSVKVMSSARINISGGWTDTPPYCYENGGRVINLSVLPKNKYPIEVTIGSRDDGKLKFECLECNKSIVIENFRELFSEDIDENFLIHKNVCLATGIISEKHIKGITIKTCSDLPNGSGLGTSSIMVNACLIGVFKAFNITYDNDYLINKTLQVEQMMGFGGGWQDQAGVVWPGIKAIETKPGLPQKYKCETYDINSSFVNELNDKMVLIYSGKRRKSKNILRKVVSNYLIYENDICEIYENKNAVTAKMDQAIRKCSINELSGILSESYKLNKKMDSSCINNTIETILELLDKYITGYTICGAGGGGYVLVLIKAEFGADDIQRALRIHSDFTNFDVVKCSLTDEPIRVIVE